MDDVSMHVSGRASITPAMRMNVSQPWVPLTRLVNVSVQRQYVQSSGSVGKKPGCSGLVGHVF